MDEVNPKACHFPVLATSNYKARKFWVALSALACPPVVKLLEAVEKEFGFHLKLPFA